jgi:hypothetical protein
MAAGGLGAMQAINAVSTRSLGKFVGKTADFDNKKMVATVIYWVVRSGLVRDETDITLHDGDPSVLKELYPDSSYSHVLNELMRTGWLKAQRNRMWEICDQIYEASLDRRASR